MHHLINDDVFLILGEIIISRTFERFLGEYAFSIDNTQQTVEAGLFPALPFRSIGSTAQLAHIALNRFLLAVLVHICRRRAQFPPVPLLLKPPRTATIRL